VIDGVQVRLMRPEDSPALVDLAALDSAPAPVGACVVAEVEGELWAAVPLAGGRAVADPFKPTADIVALLELRAAQIRAASQAEGAVASRRFRLPLRRARRA